MPLPPVAARFLGLVFDAALVLAMYGLVVLAVHVVVKIVRRGVRRSGRDT